MLNDKPFILDEFYGIRYEANELNSNRDFYLKHYQSSQLYSQAGLTNEEECIQYAISHLAAYSLINIAMFKEGPFKPLTSIILYYGYYWNGCFDTMEEVSSTPDFPSVDERVCKYWTNRLAWACKNLNLEFKQPHFFKYMNLNQINPNFLIENDNAEEKA